MSILIFIYVFFYKMGRGTLLNVCLSAVPTATYIKTEASYVSSGELLSQIWPEPQTTNAFPNRSKMKDESRNSRYLCTPTLLERRRPVRSKSWTITTIWPSAALFLCISSKITLSKKETSRRNPLHLTAFPSAPQSNKDTNIISLLPCGSVIQFKIRVLGSTQFEVMALHEVCPNSLSIKANINNMIIQGKD